SHFLIAIDWPQLTDFLLLLEFANSVLQALETSIETLSFNEKLWLLERIVQLLRAPQSVSQGNWTNSLATMAEDSDIQAEITRINNEFMVAETDSLGTL
ncbi:MAG: hypothetical protein AAFQ89_01265, partial [Cyanobacteria bacterium J06626_18]